MRIVKASVLLTLVVLIAVVPGSAVAQVLFGCDRDGQIFQVDEMSGVGTFQCNLPTYPNPGATEIAYDMVARWAVVQTRDGVFTNQIVDIFNCAPHTGEVFNGYGFNGLEYVNGVLYGTAIIGSCAPSELRKLDPIAGTSTLIGPTGKGPIAGLAWDMNNLVMYGITGCARQGDKSELVTIDLMTGAATAVGSTGIEAGSLAFGTDGNLYAGGSRNDGGNLYRIDPADGSATLVGPTGFSSVTGLTVAVFPVATEESTWGRIKSLYQR